MKILVTLSVIFLLSACHEKPKEIQFKEAVGFLGHSVYEIADLLKGTEYHFILGEPRNGDIQQTYSLNKNNDPFDFIIFKRCGFSDIICSVTYTISENDFTNNIPKLLKELNYKGGEIQIMPVAKDSSRIIKAEYLYEIDREKGLYTFVSLRKKTWTKSHYMVEISSFNAKDSNKEE